MFAMYTHVLLGWIPTDCRQMPSVMCSAVYLYCRACFLSLARAVCDLTAVQMSCHAACLGVNVVDKCKLWHLSQCYAMPCHAEDIQHTLYKSSKPGCSGTWPCLSTTWSRDACWQGGRGGGGGEGDQGKLIISPCTKQHHDCAERQE